MKSKTFACNDNNGLDRMITEFVKDKQVKHISSIIFVLGNFIVHIMYYDIALEL